MKLVKKRKIITSSMVIAFLSLPLTGCGLTALPDEERYAYINSLKDDTDYASAGKVLEEGYDKADGVFSTSYWKAIIQGDEVYEHIEGKLKNVRDLDCNFFLSPEEQRIIECDKNVASLSFTVVDKKNDIYELKILDATGGRGSGE